MGGCGDNSSRATWSPSKMNYLGTTILDSSFSFTLFDAAFFSASGSSQLGPIPGLNCRSFIFVYTFRRSFFLRKRFVSTGSHSRSKLPLFHFRLHFSTQLFSPQAVRLNWVPFPV